MATNNGLNLPEGSAGQLVINTGTGFTNTTATYPSTAGTTGNILVSDGTDLKSVAMSSDVHIVSSGATTIQNGVVTNAKLANMADQTIKGNVSGGSAAPSDLTALQVSTMLNAYIYEKLAQGRLTLASGVPITMGDVTAATTIYFTPEFGNYLDLYNGTKWERLIFTEISIAVPATTNQMYDIFVFNNAGTATLELTAWTNDTTRATALVTQDGVLVKSGATTRRYLGSFRTTGVAGQTEDSILKRFLWNLYNQTSRKLKAIDTTNSWNYTTATWRQANANAANQVEVVIGISEQFIPIEVFGAYSNTNASITASVGIGISVTNANSADVFGFTTAGAGGGSLTQAKLLYGPADGSYFFFAWLEQSAATGTTTWYGDNNTTLLQSGITAMIMG